MEVYRKKGTLAIVGLVALQFFNCFIFLKEGCFFLSLGVLVSVDYFWIHYIFLNIIHLNIYINFVDVGSSDIFCITLTSNWLALVFAATMSSVEASPGFDLIQVRIESLSSKMDTLISIQEKVLYRLDSMSEELVGIERDMETLKVDKEEMPPASRTKGPARGIGGEMKEMCQEMNSIMTAVNKRSEQQTQKLEGMERLVMSIQQVVSFIGETVKTSRITELMFKGPAARKSKAALAPGCKNQDSKHGAKRQASGEPVPGKVSLICRVR